MPAELTLIAGPSGSGKTTLLNIISGIELPDEGTVRHGDVTVTDLTPEQRTEWRGQHVGFAFQHARLLNNLTVVENIVAPMILRGQMLGRDDAVWADQLSATLGIQELLPRQVAGLSGGQKQRVALARALVHRPDVLIADEPTAAVDGQTKIEIHELMRTLVEQDGVTVVMVSHDSLSPEYADKIVHLRDGSTTSDK
jgi:ABC-type lipoprotein export system ATPase subunit